MRSLINVKRFAKEERSGMMAYGASKLQRYAMLKYKDLEKIRGRKTSYKKILHEAVMVTAVHCTMFHKVEEEYKTLLVVAHGLTQSSIGESKFTIPFDYDLIKTSLEIIRKTLGFDSDYKAIWFAIEYYILKDGKDDE